MSAIVISAIGEVAPPLPLKASIDTTEGTTLIVEPPTAEKTAYPDHDLGDEVRVLRGPRTSSGQRRKGYKGLEGRIVLIDGAMAEVRIYPTGVRKLRRFIRVALADLERRL